MIAVVLAGGSGTRLWPLSRYAYPKQFIKVGGKTFLLRTLERVCLASPENVLIVANENYRFFIGEELEKASCEGELLIEPSPKNTAPAIALAVAHLRKMGIPDETVLFVFPSDHVVEPDEVFVEDVKKAESLAREGFLVTFGVKPIYPEVGFGYIEKGDKLGDGVFKVKAFREKPSREVAQEYLRTGGFLWNSGMFAFRIDAVVEEFKRYSPDVYGIISGDDEFSSVPAISIDYAVMEKTDRAAVVEAHFKWSDVGSWRSFYDIIGDRDKSGTVLVGDVINFGSSDSLIVSESRLVVAVGLNGYVVVETPDAVLVSSKDKVDMVKDVVSELKKLGRKEAIEHRTVYRPWGSYTVLEEGDRYKIKRITIKPGASLSLQMHYHRSEHWVVVRGTARVVMEDKEMIIHEDESFYVPKSRKHRLENPGKIPVEIIEIQTGEYLGEDDIVRFKDKYGRET